MSSAEDRGDTLSNEGGSRVLTEEKAAHRSAGGDDDADEGGDRNKALEHVGTAASASAKHNPKQTPQEVLSRDHHMGQS